MTRLNKTNLARKRVTKISKNNENKSKTRKPHSRATLTHLTLVVRNRQNERQNRALQCCRILRKRTNAELCWIKGSTLWAEITHNGQNASMVHG